MSLAHLQGMVELVELFPETLQFQFYGSLFILNLIQRLLEKDEG